MTSENMATENKALDPENCETMEDVRLGVDTLDRELVKLLLKRQGYMAAAARIKPTSGDVRVPWRIEDVVEKVCAEASKIGLSTRIAEPVWRVLIEQCIEYELELWHELRSGSLEKKTANQ